MCCHGDRQVVRLDMKTRERKTLADKYDGRRLNSPNDLVFNRNGDLYFTDPPYGLPKRYDDPARETRLVRRLSPGERRQADPAHQGNDPPQRHRFSPDYTTLYVAQSDPKAAIWKAFLVNSDGTLGKGRLFYDTTQYVDKPEWPGLPDGLKVDEQGNLFATGPGGVLDLHPRGQAPRPPRHRRKNRQLRLRRRRPNPLHHRRHAPVANPHEYQRHRVLTS